MVLFLRLSLSSCVVRKLVQVTPACIILTDHKFNNTAEEHVIPHSSTPNKVITMNMVTMHDYD